jgi:hypothetical protein
LLAKNNENRASYTLTSERKERNKKRKEERKGKKRSVIEY